MFAEFVTPEIAIGAALVDPVFVHVSEQIELAEGGEEGADAGSFVRWDGSSG